MWILQHSLRPPVVGIRVHYPLTPRDFLEEKSLLLIILSSHNGRARISYLTGGLYIDKLLINMHGLEEGPTNLHINMKVEGAPTPTRAMPPLPPGQKASFKI